MVIPFGKPAKWYENHRGREALGGTRRIQWTGNETVYTDLFGDGDRSSRWWKSTSHGSVCRNPNPSTDWRVNNVSERFQTAFSQRVKPTHKLAHGLGAADVNGDGRKDIVTYGGWWNSPKTAVNMMLCGSSTRRILSRRSGRHVCL